MGILLGIIAMLVLTLLGYTVRGIVRMQTPTTGRPIDRAARLGKALVVVDVQDDFTHQQGKYAWDPAYLDQRLAAINRTADQAKAARIPIVTVRQMLEGVLAVAIARCLVGPAGTKGSPGLGLDTRLTFHADADFTKPYADAFSNPVFEQWLDAHQIGTLQIAGLDGCYCVNKTARGALNRGYGVELLAEAILTHFPDWWAAISRELTQAAGTAA